MIVANLILLSLVSFSLHHLVNCDFFKIESNTRPDGGGGPPQGAIATDPGSGSNSNESLTGLLSQHLMRSKLRSDSNLFSSLPNASSSSSSPSSPSSSQFSSSSSSPASSATAISNFTNFGGETWSSASLSSHQLSLVNPEDGEEAAYDDEEEEEKGPPLKRGRRSYSHDRHVEVMVVADTKMANYHGENLKHYILTLMSTVASIYRDASIGNAINIAVVKLEVMNDDEEKLMTDKSAQKRLRHFCKWQRSRNHEDDNHPTHHDAAILLTREDLCRKPETCDTLGLAQAGKICDPSSSCAVIEDNGLAAAFTIAHELGHVLNIPHDDDEKCSRFNEEEQRHHIMARMLDYNSHPWSWSQCSKHFITEFLDAGDGDCLLDKPHGNFLQEPVIHPINTAYAEFRQPGELFDMDYQCELVFGPTSKICPYMPACNRLWCTIGNDGGCRTQHMPWADGTPCDRNKWCHRGECVHIERSLPPPVDGKWGPWSPFTPCTKSCGGGIQKSVRDCNQPKPAHSGRYCIGRRVRYRSCNTHECPPGTSDFREEQCSAFDGQTFNIQGLTSTVKWLPHYSGIVSSDLCKLYCRVQGTGAYYLLKQKVIDGTPCGPDTYNVCVNGQCLPAGCDRVLESKAKPDSCGVCGGDNSTCKLIENTFYHAQVHYGYNAITSIPAGATNLEITQLSNSPEDNNYLVLRGHDGSYVLNGDFVVSMFKQTIQYAGTTIDYSGSNQSIERINCSKPLKKPLYVEVLSVGQLMSPEVKYQYLISLKTNEYEWRLGEHWSHCNKVCNGEQERVPQCFLKNTTRLADDAYCNAEARPAKVVQVCNLHCQLKWRILSEMECSSNCGLGMKRRLIRCVQEFIPRWPNGRSGIYHELSDRYCDVATKPEVYIPCNGTCNGIYWKYSDWSECSRTCGKGVQTRSASCRNSDNNEETDQICENILGQKVVSQSCETDECPQWKTSEWSPVIYGPLPQTVLMTFLLYFQCSANCGSGKHQRSVRCQKNDRIVNDQYCELASKPEVIESCHVKSCTGQWISGDWSPCVHCANESQRQVVCRSYEGKTLDDSDCRLDEKPLTIKPCFPDPYCKKIKDLTSSRPRGRWRTGMWSTCSSSCGFGVKKRYVACVIGDNKVNDHECDPEAKPAEEEQCEIVCNDVLPIETRFAWRTGPWGNCSRECNAGLKRRLVLCYHDHQQVSDNLCKFLDKPNDTDVCDLNRCTGEWKSSDWNECSRSCGSGVQSRRVWCADSHGSTITDSDCSENYKPVTNKKCNEHICPTQRTYRWYVGPWTKCFASGCSKNGTRRRLVLCINDRDEKSDIDQCGKEIPLDHQTCTVIPKCPSTTTSTSTTVKPKQLVQSPLSSEINSVSTSPQGSWVFSDWGPCSTSCGNGTQVRQPICVGRSNGVLAVCNQRDKPEPETRSCIKRCPLFQWRKSKWSLCSNSCGKGQRTRAIQCVDWTNTVVPHDFCDPSSKPSTVKYCYRGVCPFVWQATQWSPCSTTCGPGVETRLVTCHRVTKHGFIDPLPVTKRKRLNEKFSDRCNETTKPAVRRTCNYGSCNGRGVWRPQPWEQCSAPCGTGYQRRKVPCYSPRGEKVARHYCDKKLRPRRKIKCFVKPCSPVNCTEFLKRKRILGYEKHKSKSDSSERDRLITLYCSGMLSRNSHFYSSSSTILIGGTLSSHWGWEHWPESHGGHHHWHHKHDEQWHQESEESHGHKHGHWHHHKKHEHHGHKSHHEEKYNHDEEKFDHHDHHHLDHHDHDHDHDHHHHHHHPHEPHHNYWHHHDSYEHPHLHKYHDWLKPFWSAWSFAKK